MASYNEDFLKLGALLVDANSFLVNLILNVKVVFVLIISNLEYVLKYFIFLLIFTLVILILYLLYKSYWSPMLYIKELSSLGYEQLPRGADRSLHLIRAQKSRKLGSTLPPPYPNGWFALVESMDLKIGSVISVDALGLNYCVYRGDDGAARVVEAYCPHLGANFGIGGTVSGNCIICPFHEWKFGADGVCVNIPNEDSVPKGVSIKTYPSMEVDGSVWTWYHVDGIPPQWTVKESEQLKNWGYRGRNEFFVNAHIQEVPENGADVAHLNSLHKSLLTIDAGYPILRNLLGHHVWEVEWSVAEEKHIGNVKIKQRYSMMNIDILPFEVQFHQIGPGHVRGCFNSAFGPTILIQTVTPLGPLLQKVVHKVYTPSYNAVLGPIMVIYETFQFQRDVAIWNNKKYVKNPSYVKSDKMIRQLRSWFSQFYTENSISMKDAMQNSLDW